MMTRKNIIIISSAVAGIAVISVVSAVYLRGGKGPDFTGKNTEEIKAYFKSDAFRSMNKKDQLATEKKAYTPIIRQREQEFIEQAKMYSQLPPKQKVTYLDGMIEQIVGAAEQKQQYAPRNVSGAASGARAKGGSVKTTQSSYAKKTVSSENYRAWSEKMEPEKRAYIMELKEALHKRMEQRGIEMP